MAECFIILFSEEACLESRCNATVIFFFRDMFVFSGKVNVI